MKHVKSLTDANGEVRELTGKDVSEMVKLTELPAALQSKLKKMGRPIAEVKKLPVSIRLDPDVLEAIKATGDGWQTRVNDALRGTFVRNSKS